MTRAIAVLLGIATTRPVMGIFFATGSVRHGAIAGLTMRAYIDRPEGRELFYRTYDEALTVAIATGVRPEKMLVDPIVETVYAITRGQSAPDPNHLGQILQTSR